jgi:D-alanyl-D-alanine carboxypeptidase
MKISRRSRPFAISAVSLCIISSGGFLATQGPTQKPVTPVAYAERLPAEVISNSLTEESSDSFSHFEFLSTTANNEPIATVDTSQTISENTTPSTTSGDSDAVTFTRGKCPASSTDDLFFAALHKHSQLDKYIPTDLVTIIPHIPTKDNRPVCLTRETAEQAYAMFAAAKSESIELVVTSGFRDYDWQSALYHNHIDTHGTIPQRIAPAGTSEHQLGTTFDLTTPDIDNVSASVAFGETDAGIWMAENGWKFGFVQSYPEGKQSITGYLYEPWHYRYIGKEPALELLQSGLTLYEFLRNREIQSNN